MEELDKNRAGLQSDKLKERKEGRQWVESNLLSDAAFPLSLDLRQSMYLIEAALSYEEKEIDACHKKKCRVGIDVATFVRKVFEYCSRYGRVSSYQLVDIVDVIGMTLRVLNDATLSTEFKNVHKHLMCELLDPQVAHSMPFCHAKYNQERGTQRLFLYLQDTMTEGRHAIDRVNHRLLRSLCYSMYHDIDGNKASSCTGIMEFLASLTDYTMELSEESLSLLACITDCCAALLRFQSSNFITEVIPTAVLILEKCLRHLCNSKSQSSYLQSIFTFIAVFMSEVYVICTKHSFMIDRVDCLRDIVQGLCEYSLSDEFIDGQTNFNGAHSGQRYNSYRALKGSGEQERPQDSILLIAMAKAWILYEWINENSKQELVNSDKEEMSRKKRKTNSNSSQSKSFLMELLVQLEKDANDVNMQERNAHSRRNLLPLAPRIGSRLAFLRCYLAHCKPDQLTESWVEKFATATGGLIVSPLVSLSTMSRLWSCYSFVLRAISRDDRNAVGTIQAMANNVLKCLQQNRMVSSANSDWLDLLLVVMDCTQKKKSAQCKILDSIGQSDWFAIPCSDQPLAVEYFFLWILKPQPSPSTRPKLARHIGELFSDGTVEESSLIEKSVSALSWQALIVLAVVCQRLSKLQLKTTTAALVTNSLKSLHLLVNAVCICTLQSVTMDYPCMADSVHSILERNRDNSQQECAVDWDKNWWLNNNLCFLGSTYNTQTDSTYQDIYISIQELAVDNDALSSLAGITSRIVAVWEHAIDHQLSDTDLTEPHIAWIEIGIVLLTIFRVLFVLSSRQQSSEYNLQRGFESTLCRLLLALQSKLTPLTLGAISGFLGAISKIVFLFPEPIAVEDPGTASSLRRLWEHSIGIYDSRRAPSSQSQHSDLMLTTPSQGDATERSPDSLAAFVLTKNNYSMAFDSYVQFQTAVLRLAMYSNALTPTSLRNQLSSLSNKLPVSKLGLAIATSFASLNWHAMFLFVWNSIEWYQEWGPIGFQYLLKLALGIVCFESATAQPVIAPMVTDDNGHKETIHTELMKVLLTNSDVVHRCYQLLWSCRNQRLLCLCYLMEQPKLLSTFKSLLPDIFLSATIDCDVRVRMTCSRICPQLIRLFANPGKVFSSLLHPLLEPSLSFTAMQAVVACQATSDMIATLPEQLLRPGLVHILTICSTIQSQFDALSFVKDTIERLSCRLKFTSSNKFVSCHVHQWLLDWIDHSIIGDPMSETSLRLTEHCSRCLQLFPFELLLEEASAFRGDASPRKWAIRRFREDLVCTIVQVNGVLSRALLSGLCMELGYPTTDQQIVKLIQKAVFGICSTKMVLQTFGKSNSTLNSIQYSIDTYLSLEEREMKFDRRYEGIFIEEMFTAIMTNSSLVTDEKSFSEVVLGLENCLTNAASHVDCDSLANWFRGANLYLIFALIHEYAYEPLDTRKGLCLMALAVVSLKHSQWHCCDDLVIAVMKMAHRLIAMDSRMLAIVDFAQSLSIVIDQAKQHLSQCAWRVIVSEYMAWILAFNCGDAFASLYLASGSTSPLSIETARSLSTCLSQLLERSQRFIFLSTCCAVPIEIQESLALSSPFPSQTTVMDTIPLLRTFLDTNASVFMIWTQLSALKISLEAMPMLHLEDHSHFVAMLLSACALVKQSRPQPQFELFNNLAMGFVPLFSGPLTINDSHSSKFLAPFRYVQYNTLQLMLLIVDMLCNNLFHPEGMVLHAAKSGLAHLSHNKFFQKLLKQMTSVADSTGTVSQHSHNIDLKQFQTNAVLDKLHVIDVFRGSQIEYQRIALVQELGSDALWDDAIWTMDSHASYATWLQTLTLALCQHLHELLRRPHSNTQLDLDKHQLPIMLSQMPIVCVSDCQMCELIFPLLIAEHQAICSPLLFTKLCSRISESMLSLQCRFTQATTLACNMLLFLSRQRLEDIPTQMHSNTANRQPDCLITCFDLRLAAAAALRCNFPAASLFFAEQVTGQSLPNALSDESVLFAPIYKALGDSDSLEAFSASDNFLLQAQCFANKKDYLQALTTIESFIESQSQSMPSEARSQCVEGLQRALQGLGSSSCSQALINHSQASNLLNEWALDLHDIDASVELSCISNRLPLTPAALGTTNKSLRPLAIQSWSRAMAHAVNLSIGPLNNDLQQFLDFCCVDVSAAVTETRPNSESNSSSSSSNIVCFNSSLVYRRALSLEDVERSIVVLKLLAVTKRIRPDEAILTVNNIGLADRSECNRFSSKLYSFWSTMQHISPENKSVRLVIDAQESQLLWGKGLASAALSKLDSVISRIESEQQPSLHANPILGLVYAASLRQRGIWTSLRGSMVPKSILDSYLKKSMKVCDDAESRACSALAIAEFAVNLFQSLEAKTLSSEWALSQRVLRNRETEYQQSIQLRDQLAGKSSIVFNGMSIDNRELSRHINALKKEIEMDRNERQLVLDSMDVFAREALSHYSCVLRLWSSRSSLNLKLNGADQESTFRLIGFWLSNSTRDSVNETMSEVLPTIPSHFLIGLTYQIFSRLGITIQRATSPCDSANRSSSSGPSFEAILNDLVYRMCCEHPHHTLPQLLALINVTSLNSQVARGNSSTDRQKAAERIYNRLLQASSSTIAISKDMNKLLRAYIDLAEASTSSFQKAGKLKGISFTDIQYKSGTRFDTLIMSLFQGSPPLLTAVPNKRIDGDYSKAVVTISQVHSSFCITEQGISRPKIIVCLANDGNEYRQIVKSGDDMRQDAVMQQVFRLINKMLDAHPETKHRQLHIRTYAVIPTNPQTGLLEWVEGTTTFGSILIDKTKGLHNRYHRDVWTHVQCREHFMKATSNEDKETRYQEICQNFSPIFRYFFLEQFAHPFDWIMRRNAFVRSMATNSIAGYILGIGDRHAFNILLDHFTGEIVHIDFGIVFDQGKGLITPETIPFRLTRELVDGMGITGYEGAFRRACEEILRVLRNSTAQLLTILEVIIHDPLYKWSLSPFEACSKQLKDRTVQTNEPSLVGGKTLAAFANRRKHSNSTASSEPGAESLAADTNGAVSFGQDAAERTLIKIRNKLRGNENPTVDSLSIESQIDLLINEATSTDNLSKLFHGWTAWL